MLKTAVVTDRAYLTHCAGHEHPERPERVQVLLDMLDGFKRSALVSLRPRPATRDELTLCHDSAYVSFVEGAAAFRDYQFDPDTYACPGSFETALLAAGGVLTAVEAVIGGEADNAFAIVRPPGHHALARRAMGFCLFNNVAIAAAYLVERLGCERVMIIDWDLHHGNGTQELFYQSSRVLYASLHQYPFYPGTGAVNEVGVREGAGFTVNAPLPAGCEDEEYLRVFDELFAPIARQFKPQFLLISAGYDCHARDPLGHMRVSEAGFAAMARRAKRLAAENCGGKLVAALEGGYDLEALANSTRATLEEFGREADEPIIGARAGRRADAVIEKALFTLGRFWPL
jgi:acetoin utilization deacetylase AcuC-like enzyme